MPYRLDPAEPTDVGLRRVVAEQLDRAVLSLRVPGGPDAEAVHDVRKRLKKARSAVRLGRADLGVAVARHANGELRRVGRELALHREADALVEVVDQLIDGAAGAEPTETAAALASIRELLLERAAGVRLDAPLDRRSVLGASRTLAQTSSWLRLVPARSTGWPALGPGLGREYRRGRRLLLDLPAEPSVDELHAWRKRVKDLWYHERLLRRCWTDVQRPIVSAAGHLAELLGEDHDLGLLQAHLVAPGEPATSLVRVDAPPIEPLVIDDDVRRRARAAATERRAELQAEARRIGALLYADRPAAWVARHGAWWTEAQLAAGPAPEAVDAGPADPPTTGTTA